MFGVFDYVLLILLFLAAVGMVISYKIYMKLVFKDIKKKIASKKISVERRINHNVSENVAHDHGELFGLEEAEKIIKEALEE